MFIGQTLLPKWFVLRRERALGIAAFGTAMGTLILPSVIQTVIDALGFRWAWMVLGLAAPGILVPLSFLVRTQPEDIGLLPDNAPAKDPAEVKNAAQVNQEEHSLTRREALRTPAFWFVVSAMALAGLGVLGFQSNRHAFFNPSQRGVRAHCGGLLGLFLRHILDVRPLHVGRSVRKVPPSQPSGDRDACNERDR